MTVDYMDNVDILIQQNDKQKDLLYRNNEGVIIPEYYYWPLDEYKEVYDVYDGDILGLKVNDDGTLLAVWTENNFIYIYKRGTGDDHVVQDNITNSKQQDDDTNAMNDNNINNGDADSHGGTKSPHATTTLPIKSLSLVDQLDVLLGLRLPLPSTTQTKQHPDLPPRWFLRMVITPHDKSSRQAVSLVKQAKKKKMPNDKISLLYDSHLFYFISTSTPLLLSMPIQVHMNMPGITTYVSTN